MKSIPSPYNFVPLSEYVFFPSWSKNVSMDIPFSDSVSGVLEIIVEAITPMFIGSGRKESSEFFRVLPNGDFAIPGTSLKGMLRNVLEIVSFGKIKADDHRYSIRDLNNPNRDLYIDHLTKNNDGGSYEPLVKAGWLEKDKEGSWLLRPCKFARIEQEKIEEKFKGLNLGERQSAVTKYNDFYNCTKNSERLFQFKIEDKKAHKHSGNKILTYIKAVWPSDELETTGQIVSGALVFTGQPARRDGKPGKKHMEFVFFDSADKTYEIPERVIKDFIFIHSDENGKPNEEWGFWKKALDEGKRVPIFYLGDDTKISSMGLAMMFRLPYRYSIHDAIKHTSKAHLDNTQRDLAETIFGYADHSDSLRGRVQIETLISINSPAPMQPVKTILNTPKPTFYPNYVEQEKIDKKTNKVEEYTTFMDQSCRIRGWKRYPTRTFTHPLKPNQGQERVSVTFTPLPKGTKFQGFIHIHNLRKVELGALLWVITWGGNDQLRHSLGMGKPYGFGSVKLTIGSNSCLKDVNGKNIEEIESFKKDAMKEFQNIMEQFLKDNNANYSWEDSPQMKNLLAMAKPKDRLESETYSFSYPILDHKNRINEFAKAKKEYLYLVPFVDYTLPPARIAPPSTDTSIAAEISGDISQLQGKTVQCIVLDKKTKKGKPLFQVMDYGEDACGVLVPSEKIPDNLVPGQKITLKVRSASPKNFQFELAK